MNILLFFLALIGWGVAIIAAVAFSVAMTALVSTDSEFFKKLQDAEDLDGDGTGR